MVLKLFLLLAAVGDVIDIIAYTANDTADQKGVAASLKVTEVRLVLVVLIYLECMSKNLNTDVTIEATENLSMLWSIDNR